MRGRKTITSRRRAATRARKISGQGESDYSEELMDLAVAAANSRELPAFLAGVASRAAEMMDAQWGGGGEIIGNPWELYSPAREFPANQATWDWLLQNISCKRAGLEVSPVPEGQSQCAFFPIYASDGELMGTLCLIRDELQFSPAQEKLLMALASHAALSMEKVRRFSQLERSKKQWVEDIDAISDYIVVHDQSWRIVRTNRTLATHLGRPPAALVGEPMSSLRRIAETGSALPCPFCHNPKQSREEY